MGEDKNPDALPAELPDHADHNKLEKSTMSFGAPSITNADDVSPVNGATNLASQLPHQLDANGKAVHDVVNSEIGVSTLLNRLKQSIASAREFASFLKKRSFLEEEHSNGLKKLCRTTAENIRKPDCRHGSLLQSIDEMSSIHERMSENGSQFAASLHQMHDDLVEMAINIERGRKHWKANGLAAEQRVADTEAAVRKSKAKYNSLAEDYDRARTGDRQPGKKFGLKGPKSAQQHEEDLLKKVQAADADYASKVQAAQAQQAELLSKLRPDAVRNLESLIKECDSALTLQMQKFASFNEKLILSNGLIISPLRGEGHGNPARSLREAVHAIDNEKDFSNYIGSFVGKLPNRNSEIIYERNPALNPTHATTPQTQRQPDPPASFDLRPIPPQQTSSVAQPPSNLHVVNQPFTHTPPAALQHHDRPHSQGGHPQSQQYNNSPVGVSPRAVSHPQSYNHSTDSGAPPQLLPLSSEKRMPFQQDYMSHGPGQVKTSFQQDYMNQGPGQSPYSQTQNQPSFHDSPTNVHSNLRPQKPVFGVSLEQLFERDGSAVPMVVYQCIQAVDLFGLEVEGIYRLSGTATHITKLKAMFDNDASRVEFRNPENFYHDVNSVAGLLKQFFRELPDPLLTAEHYSAFIEAARHDDDTFRRDSLHAIINSLPDPNYATLRALTLHLNRVQANSGANRMSSSNLAIVFGPTLMGASTGGNIQDAGWQSRVIDTILVNALQIFDDD